jgi:PAS domain S-box-containing protein
MNLFDNPEKLFLSICDAIRIFALIITDSKNNIKKVNKGFEFIFEITPKEIESLKIIDLFNDKSKYNEIMEGLNSLDIIRRDVEMKKKNNEIFIADLTVSKLFDENNQPYGFVYFIFDITEHKKLEENIQKKNLELIKLYNYAQEANKSKSVFLANMSHELRTPLTAILGFSELLLEEKVGKLNMTQKDFINDIYTSGKHLLNLINDILDLAKVEADKMEFNIEKVNLIDVIKASKVFILPLANKKSLSIIDEIPQEIIYVKADETRLKQVLYNLYSNAVKFTPQGGKIITKVEVKDDFAYTSVIDTGIGIKPEHQDLIFEEFIQIQNPFTKEYSGTGLGLAICKKFLEKMDGEIKVYSEGENKGSNFTFKLPLWKE